MLSPQEKRAIEADFPHYPDRQALCLEALKVVQRQRGVVSDENLRDIAELLDISVEAVESVASFYNPIFRLQHYRRAGRNAAR